MDINKNVHVLPRGGTLVMTKLGPIQFGCPPETIKDSMVLGLGIPQYFVIPTERFVKKFGPSQGINVAEFEFPAYCNFFFKSKRVCLVVNSEDVKKRIQRVFQETLLGPTHWDPTVDFDPSFPVERRPDLMRELAYFRKFGDKLISVDMLLSFAVFDDKTGAVTLESADGKDKVRISRASSRFYVVTDATSGAELARVAAEVHIPPPPKLLGLAGGAGAGAGARAHLFVPPLFGVTVLGSSHGFDPAGKTSGYVLWINRRGIMIDPPPNSSSVLQDNSIAPSLIDGVIVTHCHADHDAGTFQKILQEGKVTLMTTPTIFGCFVRKYSALSGLEESFINQVLQFRPVRVGEPVKIRGGHLSFFYSLHSIPCVGFEAFFGGKSIVFSADHMNDPKRVQQLCADKVLSEGRRDHLLAFPWHHDLILHEAGVPPIHTPMDTLAALPEEVKRKLKVVHVALDKIPQGSGLSAAIPGVENTIVLEAQEPPFARALETLDLISSIPMFASLTVKHASELLSCSKVETFAAGEAICRRGEVGHSFYAIMSGQCEVRIVKEQQLEDAGDATVKHFHAGDYFGETAMLSENAIRTADIKAVGEVKVLRFDRADCRWLLKNTDVVQKMTRLAEMRDNGSWGTMEANTVLSKMSVSQKTHLETAFVQKHLLKGQQLWRSGDAANFAVLVQTGSLVSPEPVLAQKHDARLRTHSDPTAQRAAAHDGDAAANDDDDDAQVAAYPEPLPEEVADESWAHSARTSFGRGAIVLDVDALLRNGAYDFDLQAADESNVLLLHKDMLKDFFQANPGVLLSLMHARYVL